MGWGHRLERQVSTVHSTRNLFVGDDRLRGKNVSSEFERGLPDGKRQSHIVSFTFWLRAWYALD